MILLTIAATLGIPLLTFFILASIWFILKPYLLFRFYQEQGAAGYFKPFGAFFHDRMREARQNGDFLKYFKDTIHKRPNTKAVASNVGTQAMLYLVDPDMIKEFVNQPQLYRKAEFISGVEGLFEGQGILFTEGEKWKKQRKILTGVFHNELLKEQVPIMAKVAEEVYSNIRDKSRDLNNVNIMKANQKIAGDIIGQFFFGKRYADYKFEGHSITMGLRKLLKDGFKQMYTVWNAIFGAWFIKAGLLPQHKELMDRIENFRATMKNIIYEIKRKTKYAEDEQEKTIINLLIQQQKQSPENSMTDEEIIDNFISLFLAGTDPSGNLVSMILYHLTQYPEVYQKTLKEINENIADEREITFEETHKLDYTQAVIKEALRMTNPQGIMVFRQAVDDHKLKDMHIRRGTLVTFSPMFAGFNQKYFPDCYHFCPERWLPGGDKLREMKETPFAFIPFSAGPRTCLGHHLAMVEAKVMLVSLLKKFKFDLSPGYSLKMTNRGTYEPLENMKMKLTAL